MRKRTLILSICIMVASSYGLYQVKWKAHNMRDQNILTEAAILKEEQALEVLSAEWSYLTRPERLEKLATKYLPDLTPANGTQIADLKSFPPQITETDSNDNSSLKYSSYSASKQ